MAKAVKSALILAAITLFIGIVSRIAMTPVPLTVNGLEFRSLVIFDCLQCLEINNFNT